MRYDAMKRDVKTDAASGANRKGGAREAQLGKESTE